MTTSVEKLWRHAVKRAGTAVDPTRAEPPLPSLKMREVTFALLHFLELLEPLVPADVRAIWTVELAASRTQLESGAPTPAGSWFAPMETTASWQHLSSAFRQAVLRAAAAPSLAGAAQRAVVGIAFGLLRKSSNGRTEANIEIRRGLERLEAGLWLAAARSRLGDKASQLARGVWGAPHLALFETRNKQWWLVRLPPGRPISLECGGRDDVLATIPDAHFASAVAIVLPLPAQAGRGSG